MSTVGQAAGGIIGFFLGGPTGAAIGMTLGGIIDPPKGPTIHGPRLGDLSAQTAGYGAPLPRIYGKTAVHGNVFWIENNKVKEVVRKNETSGKGGGSTSTTFTYEYFGTFAVALADHEIDDVLKIWFGSDLISNPASSDPGTLIASHVEDEYVSGGAFDGVLVSKLISFSGHGGSIRIYLGKDHQDPDPRMEADIGVGSTSAYRGMAYAVIYDWPLKKYTDSIAGVQAKFEVLETGSTQSLLELSSIDVTALNNSGAYEDGGAYYFSNLNVEILNPQFANPVSKPANHIVQQVTSSGAIRSRTYASDAGDESPGGGWTLPLGRSDKPVDFHDGIWGPPFNDNQGVTQFEYKADKRYSFLSSTIKNLITTATATLAGIQAMAVDDSGNAYFLVGSTIKVYNEDLTLLRTITLPFTLNTGRRMDWAHGLIYILEYQTGPDYTLYQYDETTDDYSSWTITPSANFKIDTIQLYVNNALVILYEGRPTVDLHTVRRFRLPYTAGTTVNLSTIISAELQRSQYIDAADIDVSLITETVDGYTIPGSVPIRTVIEQLRTAYPFDLIPSGAKIKAIPRGQASVRTIDEDDLIWSGGFKLEREMDSQLPANVTVRYLDAERNYDFNQQISGRRQASESVDKREVNLPFVFTANKAAQIAEWLETVPWVERVKFPEFVLPPSHRDLEPADIIKITSGTDTFEMRLEALEYQTDGTIKARASQSSASSWTSSAVGSSGTAPTNQINYAGLLTMVLFDAPIVRDKDDRFGFGAAISAADFVNASLMVSSDSGITFDLVGAQSEPVTMGYGQTPLPVHDHFTIDRTNTLTVELITGTLSSITEAQMMTGLHYCLYGVEGRWEIMRFAGVTLNGDGSYTLDTLIRGQRGTEQYTGTHKDGDLFILLDDPDVILVGAEASTLNVSREYKAARPGEDLNDITETDYAYAGVNLKPLSAINLAAVQSGSPADISISWTARSRLSTSWWKTGVSRLLGETPESWEVDIMDTSVSPNTVKRTLTASTSAATYTNAQQVTDFGATQSTVTFKVYLLSADVGRGYAATATVTF